MSQSPEQAIGATDISVIVPVLNEAEVIADCLAQFEVHDDVQVLVVDGGSEDDTETIVKESTVGEWVTSECAGRARQMNTGANQAAGQVFVFLHADCILPATWVSDVTSALTSSDTVGGRFRLGISEDTLSFRLIAFFSTLRSRLLGITYGDQAIFVRRVAFETVGGFPSRKIFEDSEFCDSISRHGRFVMVDTKVTSSSRRWRAWGVWRTVLRMWVLRVLYTLSVSDERLSRMYRNVR